MYICMLNANYPHQAQTPVSTTSSVEYGDPHVLTCCDCPILDRRELLVQYSMLSLLGTLFLFAIVYSNDYLVIHRRLAFSIVGPTTMQL